MSMKPLYFSLSILLLSLIFSACNSSVSEETDSRPNLVLIIADDMAWNDCGAYGHPTIRTPNLDRLATEGMRFDNAFLTTSSCSPSRTSMITGMYPHNTDAEQLHWPLPGDKKTFVEVLKQNGYWTGLAGKYHMGDAIKDRFDLIKEVGTAGFQLSPTGEEQPIESDGSGCENWIPILQERPKDQPFFLWLAAVDPHRGYQAGAVLPGYPLEDIRIPSYMPDTEETRGDFALYYEEITRLDRYVGLVLEELEKQDVVENTLVLFISDNGRPFPRDKTTLYDGGIKTPWILRWPRKVKAGRSNPHLVSSIDIAPTFLQLAQLDPLTSFEGKDFSTLLVEPEATIRDFVYAEDHWHDVEDYTRAVRTDSFKYIRNFFPELPNTPPADALRSPTFESMRQLRDAGELTPDQMLVFNTPRPEEELFDVINDPEELNNLVDDPNYVAVLQEMRQKMETIRTETRDKLPAFSTPDEFDRETGLPLPIRARPRASKAEMMKKYAPNR